MCQFLKKSEVIIWDHRFYFQIRNKKNNNQNFTHTQKKWIGGIGICEVSLYPTETNPTYQT